MSVETKFEKLWTLLMNCQYDLPEELKPILKKDMQETGFFDAPTTTVVTTVGTTTQTKKLSGYNIFMKEKMAELKAQQVPAAERMGKVSVLWKALYEEQKAEWKAKASQVAPVSVTVKATEKANGPKKLSGYQLYVKETMPIVKVKAEIPAKERMAEIGKMWKTLSEEQKAEWKVKAEKM